MLRLLLYGKNLTLRVAEGSGTAKSMFKNMEILHGKEIKLDNLSKKVHSGTNHSLEYYHEDGL